MRYKDRKPENIYVPPKLNLISGAVVKAAFAVHSTLGPGLLESVYDRCLGYELQQRGFNVKHHVPVSIYYGDLEIEQGFFIDLLVNDLVVVELKAIETVLPVHYAQVLTYMKLADYRIGLLINFNVPLIRDGIKRLIL